MDCEGPAAGRRHDYEEKYVAMKPLSPSKDFKMEDTKEYKVSEPSTLHLARPSVVCCGSSAHAHNRANFDHEMVLMSAGWNQHEVSSQTRPSARGLTTGQQQQESQCEGEISKAIIIICKIINLCALYAVSN